jgi:hypothetical protein
MDNTSNFLDASINPFNHQLSKALSAFDMTHNFVVSYAYSLPFQRLTTNRALGKVVGGWRVSGITRFTTGLPITMGEGDDHSLSGTSGVDRPNYDGSPIQFMNPRDSANLAYFSTAPFSKEVLGVAGNSSRRFFHGPGLNNWDAMLQKVTPIGERFSAEFRLEVFNVFNHAQFLNPSGSITSSHFGLVRAARDPRIGQVALKLNF